MFAKIIKTIIGTLVLLPLGLIIFGPREGVRKWWTEFILELWEPGNRVYW